MTPNDDIQKILSQLDSGNDSHWTDDGAPSLEAVQQIGNDTSITRDQINKAIPGFSRAGTDEEPADADELKAEAKAVQAKTASAQSKMVTPREPNAPPTVDEGDIVNGDEYVLDPKDPLSDAPVLSRDRVKEIMQKRIEKARERVDSGRAAVSAAQAYVNKAEVFLNQAMAQYQQQFPPMHEIDAVKAHLASQMQLRAEQAGRPDLYRQNEPVAASPLDARMGQRKGRPAFFQPART